MEQNEIDSSWYGPYDDAPDCFYNSCVGCNERDCVSCGWNPFVSYARIVTKYGQKNADYLTMQSS